MNETSATRAAGSSAPACSPCRPWWPGDSAVEPFMPPVAAAIARHLPTGGAASIDIYNRAYEAVHAALKANVPAEARYPVASRRLFASPSLVSSVRRLVRPRLVFPWA